MKVATLLKHIFVPHEHNSYKPHFFREITVVSIALIAVFLLGCSVGSSLFIRKTVLGANIATSVLVDLTNESRLANNESPLVRNSTLDTAATLKATDMVQNNYFSHDSPSGITPWHWFTMAGYSFLYAGENLAINFTESRDVQKAWMDSPTHRENLLNVHFKEIGMAAMEGMYKGAPTIFIVQMFGTKAQAKEVEQSATTTVPDVIETKMVEKDVIPKKEEFALETTQNPGEVKGEADEPKDETPKEVLVPIVETANLAIVKKTSSEDVGSSTRATVITDSTPTVNVNQDISSEVVKEYSTWYEWVLFFTSTYIGYIYKVMIIIVVIAFCVLLLVEFRRQHYKHALYGVMLLIVLSIFLTINSLFIN